MGFTKRRDDLPSSWRSPGPGVIYRSGITSIIYETKPEIIKRVLPSPLEPMEKPYVILNFNDLNRTNYDIGYKEPAIMIPATYKGMYGQYTIGMAVNADIAVFTGRMSGYPKKCAKVKNEWIGEMFSGSAERHDIKFLQMFANFDEQPNDPSIEAVSSRLFAPGDPTCKGHEKDFINWLFIPPFYTTWDSMADNTTAKATLFRGWKFVRPLEPVKYGSGKINFTWSDDDPWAELEVVKILGARHAVTYFELQELQPVGEVPMKDYLPYAYHGFDDHHDYMEPYPEINKKK